MIDLNYEFDSIGKYLDAARETVLAGHMPSLARLDQRIADLCAAILKEEPEIKQECLPKLSAILEKLDIVENEIRAFKAAHDKKVSQ